MLWPVRLAAVWARVSVRFVAPLCRQHGAVRLELSRNCPHRSSGNATSDYCNRHGVPYRLRASIGT